MAAYEGNIGNIAANFADHNFLGSQNDLNNTERWKASNNWIKKAYGHVIEGQPVCAFSPHMWMACMFLFIAAGVRLYDAGGQNKNETQEISRSRGIQLRVGAVLCMIFGALMIVPTASRIFMNCDGNQLNASRGHFYNLFYVMIGILLIGSGSIYIKWSNKHNGEVNKNADRTLGTMFIMVGITMLVQVIAYIYKNRDIDPTHFVFILIMMLLVVVLFTVLFYAVNY